MKNTTLIDCPFEERGVHRGGTAFTDSVLRYDLPPQRVRLVDKEPLRAQQSAARWQEAGHTATAITADGRSLPVAAETQVLIATTDDPTEQARLMQSTTPRLVIGGILVASQELADLGGGVYGLGGICQTDSSLARQSAVALFHQVTRLTGGSRSSSANVRLPVFNLPQIEPVRTRLYETLGDHLVRYLTGAPLDGGGGLFLALRNASTAHVLPLHLAFREGRSRSQMRDDALLGRTLSSRSRRDRYATVYLPDTPTAWMYVVTPFDRAGVEFPPLDFMERRARERRIFATD